MSYRKGRNYEHYVERILRKMGFTCVIRSAGSKGPVDLIAINPDKLQIWFIQVKGGKHTLGFHDLRVKHLNEYRETGLSPYIFDGVYMCKAGFFVKRGNRWETDLAL